MAKNKTRRQGNRSRNNQSKKFTETSNNSGGGQLNYGGIKANKDLTNQEKLSIMGASGTSISNGYIDEEYNYIFDGPRAYDTYDEMYRSDSTIFKTILATQLPIQAGEWLIRPAMNQEGEVEDRDIEIKEFVEMNIFENLVGGRDQLLFEILNFVRDGVSLFEKTYEIKDGAYRIKKIGVRLPKSVEKWEMEGGDPGITQTLPQPIESGENKGKSIISIPDHKLLVFTFRKEGDNFAGVSMLRPVGKNWIIKKKLENFEVVGYEQQFRGVRKARVPSNTSKKDREEYLESVANFRVGNDNTIILPGDGYDFEFANMPIDAAKDIAEAIKRHDARITDIMLGMFMKLGEASKGSYGMSETNLSFFLLGLQQIVKQICYVINNYLIKELVDMNYNDVEKYPTISCGKLGWFDVEKVSAALDRFAKAGLITPDDDVEQRLREVMGMPTKVETDDTEEEQKPEDKKPQAQDATKEEIKEGEEKEDKFSFGDTEYMDGVYIGLKLSKESEQNVQKYIKDNNINGHNDLHTTLIYSAQPYTGDIKTKTNKSKASIVGFDLFGKEKDSLVMKIKSGSLSKRNKELTEKHDFVSDFSEYSPHITLSYDAKGFNTRKLPRPNFEIVFEKEYIQSIEKDKFHEGCCGTKQQQSEFQGYADLVDPKAVMTFNDDLTSRELAQLKKKSQNKKGGFARPLTFAEQKMDLSGMKKKITQLESNFDSGFSALVDGEQPKFFAKIKKLVETNDVKALGALGVSKKFTAELTKLINETRKESFNYGKETSANEIDVKVLPTTVEQKAIMSVENRQISKRISDNIDNALTLAITQAVARNSGSIKTLKVAEVMPEIKAGLTKAGNAALSNVRTLAVNGTINTGRGYITSQNEDLIYAYQYTAILDERTTNRCLSLDGRVVAPGSPEYFSYSPPQHYNCRSAWAAIKEDETFKPKITGIPRSVPAVRDITTAKPLKNPKILKGSPAIGVLKQEITVRKAKLEELRKQDKFPNRQAQHEERIKTLEKMV